MEESGSSSPLQSFPEFSREVNTVRVPWLPPPLDAVFPHTPVSHPGSPQQAERDVHLLTVPLFAICHATTPLPFYQSSFYLRIPRKLCPPGLLKCGKCPYSVERTGAKLNPSDGSPIDHKLTSTYLLNDNDYKIKPFRMWLKIRYFVLNKTRNMYVIFNEFDCHFKFTISCQQ